MRAANKLYQRHFLVVSPPRTNDDPREPVAQHPAPTALSWGTCSFAMHTIGAVHCVQNLEWTCCNGLTAWGAMGKLTTHVLNLAAGIPAAGMRIELRPAPATSSEAVDLTRPPPPITAAQTNADGRCTAPLLEGAAFRIGRYTLTFHVAAYFRALGQELPEPPFLDEVVIAFGIADPARDYHLPLLVSPWSYSTYRGS
jgi:5-hydroxyisourate hydrolase